MAKPPEIPPLPDYFALLRNMVGGSPAAAGFAGLGGLGGAAGNPASAFAAMPAMDPDEIDKKIRELEVVHMWLNGQATAVELSIKAMRVQRDVLKQMSAAGDAASKAFTADDVAKLAAAFNPTTWMEQMMPQPAKPAAGDARKRDTSSQTAGKAGSAKRKR